MKKFVIPFLIFAFLILGTVAIVLYGRGYRLNFGQEELNFQGTGLLVATSEPDGAQVYVNDNLTTATDNTINLNPGEYTVKIEKEGYFPWEKRLRVQKEVVTKADALLLPKAPRLESITINGALNPVIDPSYSRIAFTVASEAARTNGVYILDMSARPVLTLQSSSTQIADDTLDTFSQSTLTWSPDGTQLLASISAQGAPRTYLLRANTLNENPQNVTATLPNLLEVWEQEIEEEEASRFSPLKNQLKTVISSNFNIISWSPDESKILYEASRSAELPIIIRPRLVGHDNTPEQRNIEEGGLYVYDIREDKNYRIEAELEPSETPSPPMTWFPTSRHLVFVHDQKIDFMEYDGTNQTTLYAGPFVDNYVFSWPDASKVVVLTNLGNQNIPPNLYTIGISQ